MIWLLRENWLWFALSFLLGAMTTWLLFTRRTIIEELVIPMAEPPSAKSGASGTELDEDTAPEDDQPEPDPADDTDSTGETAGDEETADETKDRSGARSSTDAG